jgi:parallel beta-helix repeat protein
MRRAMLLGVGLAMILITASCSGRTTGASHFSSANNTIRLNAVGSCDTTCTAFIRYRVVGASSWTNTPSFDVPNKVTNAPWSRTVTVLPGARYEYQACGKESSQNQFFCAGPDGTSATTEPFTAGSLQPRTEAASDVFDVWALLNGQLQSAKAGDVTYWFEYGTTTAYGQRNPFSGQTITLAANTAKSVQGFAQTNPGTTYHYRLCAADQPNADPDTAVKVCGADKTFKTTVGTNVSCGQTITTNTTLGNDVAGCAGNGVVIGAPNITLDLNGHTISGDEQGETVCEGPTSGDFGVDNSGGYDGVTVKNGSILDFEEGVMLLDADDSVVHHIDLSGFPIFCQGIYSDGGDRVNIHHNSVYGARIRNIGVLLSTGAVIEANTLTEARHVGIALWTSSGGRVAGNTVSAPSAQTDFAIEFFGTANSQVVGNTVDGARFDGIVFARSDDNFVALNTVSNVRNDPDPTDPGQFGGIEAVDDADRNQIVSNVAFNNQAPGIAVGLPLSDSGSTDGNTVSNNTVRDNLGDGIIVGTLSSATLVKGNTALRNGDDGIDIDLAGVTLTDNTARNNTDWGIEAVVGVTNGGGNHASGNGRSAQCLNVACSP